MKIDENNYITRRLHNPILEREPNKMNTIFLVKGGNYGYVNLKPTNFPKNLIGKKVRFKVEVIEE